MVAAVQTVAGTVVGMVAGMVVVQMVEGTVGVRTVAGMKVVLPESHIPDQKNQS